MKTVYINASITFGPKNAPTINDSIIPDEPLSFLDVTFILYSLIFVSFFHHNLLLLHTESACYTLLSPCSIFRKQDHHNLLCVVDRNYFGSCSSLFLLSR